MKDDGEMRKGKRSKGSSIMSEENNQTKYFVMF